jgi:hypothetical protein
VLTREDLLGESELHAPISTDIRRSPELPLYVADASDDLRHRCELDCIKRVFLSPHVQDYPDGSQLQGYRRIVITLIRFPNNDRAERASSGLYEQLLAVHGREWFDYTANLPAVFTPYLPTLPHTTWALNTDNYYVGATLGDVFLFVSSRARALFDVDDQYEVALALSVAYMQASKILTAPNR